MDLPVALFLGDGGGDWAGNPLLPAYKDDVPNLVDAHR
jgi:hypothetical protein